MESNRSRLLAAMLAISIGLNIFQGISASYPDLWHNIRLAMIRPPAARPGDHVRGREGVKVTVIEFSDFQCPYCAQLHPSLKRLANEGRINWVYRNFPLSSIHPWAMQAAEAAECAGDQGKFWEYADALFDDQPELENEKQESLPAFWQSLAKGIGLDEPRFLNCLSSKRFESHIRSDIADGNSQHIDATPTFFINGKRQEGSLPYEQLERLVQIP